MTQRSERMDLELSKGTAEKEHRALEKCLEK